MSKKTPYHRLIIGSLLVILAVLSFTAGTANARSISEQQPKGVRITTPPPTPQATSFTLYDNTSYPRANLEQYGLTRAAVVYDVWHMACTDTGCTNIPTQSDFTAKVQYFVSQFRAASTTPLTLDFENILMVSATSAAQAQNELTLWQQLITWAHEAAPSAPIGMYSYDWSTSYTSLTQQLYTPGYLDYFAPAMYTYYSTLSGWDNALNLAVTHDQSLNPALPIYPYIWPQWDNSGTSHPFISASDWTHILTSLQAQTQGAILWSSNDSLDATACGWVGVTSDQAAVLTGTQSYGPLTISAATPDTCSLTRGATTAVGVTVTNNGKNASAPATLQPVAGQQGITESYSDPNIPTLPPGRSWTTTLNITVPSTETDTTALLHINYGTGDQHLTVVVP
ncbi:hypothetical protein [Arthrobacter sp. AZCC_0090]|uniref:hypothetical protein n=1 Tax=Arthrobacter sp. AZCC_0090 TaxID=2735881 RepID=UPI00161F3AC5|nr:hypothetical protein [Arthrobacter sp. AZCC_0090]MBB6406784.1 hypothetical protein [Arthrobacter sp. AZCC_0090]